MSVWDLLNKPRTKRERRIAAWERRRIIKLLTKHNRSKWCGVSDCPMPFPAEHLAALIEEDN